MTRGRRLPRALAAACALALALGACAAATRAAAETPHQPRRIVVGANRDYPPYEFIDEYGVPSGYDVDLIRAVAEAMGVPLELRAGPWGEMRRALEAGEIDALAGMLRSPERERSVEFCQEHLVVGYAIFLRKGGPDVRGEAGLAGRRVIVESGSLMHDRLRALGTAVEVIPVASEPQALRRLAAGQGDCALVPLLQGLLVQRRFGLQQLRHVSPPVYRAELCFAVARGDTALRRVLDEGLAIVHASGVYDRIYDRWFGVVDPRALRPAVVTRLALLVLVPLLALVVALWAWSGRLRRRVAERADEVRNRQRLFENVLDRSPALVYVKDPEGRYEFVNRRFEERFGIDREAARGRTDADLFPPEEAERLRRAERDVVEKGVPVQSEERTQRPDGTRHDVALRFPLLDDRGRVLRVCGIVTDVTDHRRLEEQLLHSQKMEAVGMLAGGVAHDFNNLITAVLGFTEMAASAMPESDPRRSDLDQVLKAGRRAAELTAQLLAFARKRVIEPQLVHLGALLAEMEPLLRRMLGEDIRLEVRAAPDLPPARLDPGLFQQVVVNLAVNARGAMPEGGAFTIEARLAPQRDPDLLARGAGPRPPWIEVAVRDDGAGMSEEVRQRVFEPFFTTKEAGAGSGLGLAMCYGIVRQAGGHITVRSRPGEGATFRILLPGAHGDPEAAEAAGPPVSRAAGDECVLLVEDEPLVRDLVEQVLVSRGYRVLVAPDGPTAIAVAEAHAGAIDLLLTDVVMPHSTGPEVARDLAASRPAMRVLYMSGYAEHRVTHGGVVEKGLAFIAKPFQPDELAAKVRAVLEGRA